MKSSSFSPDPPYGRKTDGLAQARQWSAPFADAWRFVSVIPTGPEGEAHAFAFVAVWSGVAGMFAWLVHLAGVW